MTGCSRPKLLGMSTATAPGTGITTQAQGQQQALVIQGGTLIDGNGGAPVPNSAIIIQANRITAVGRAGHRPYSVPYAFSIELPHSTKVAENSKQALGSKGTAAAEPLASAAFLHT